MPASGIKDLCVMASRAEASALGGPFYDFGRWGGAVAAIRRVVGGLIRDFLAEHSAELH
jgi:hypothetical protein